MLNAFKAVSCVILTMPYSTPIASLTRDFLHAQPQSMEALSAAILAASITTTAGISLYKFIKTP